MFDASGSVDALTAGCIAGSSLLLVEAFGSELGSLGFEASAGAGVVLDRFLVCEDLLLVDAARAGSTAADEEVLLCLDVVLCSA